MGGPGRKLECRIIRVCRGPKRTSVLRKVGNVVGEIRTLTTVHGKASYSSERLTARSAFARR